MIAEGVYTMDILEKHTAAYFGELRTIKRSGKIIYKARQGANSDLGLYSNGKALPKHNYSRERKNSLPLLDRVLYR